MSLSSVQNHFDYSSLTQTNHPAFKATIEFEIARLYEFLPAAQYLLEKIALDTRAPYYIEFADNTVEAGFD